MPIRVLKAGLERGNPSRVRGAVAVEDIFSSQNRT